MIGRLVLATSIGLVALAIGGGWLWHHRDRTGMLEALCEAGLPNLSRPPEVDAGMLGCTVLGPKQIVTGEVISSFELSNITSSADSREGAWFSGTSGLDSRGGQKLREVLQVTKPMTCGFGVAEVEVEGWFTESTGAYGHLGSADREFFANRILSAVPASAETLERRFGKRLMDDMAEAQCDAYGTPRNGWTP